MKDALKGVIYVGLFTIPLIPLFVADQMFFPFITGKNFTFRIVVEIIFAAWVILALLDKAYRPKFSYILAGGLAFLGIMAVANALGEYPTKSFWSNFERMDGYVTLVHFYLLFVVIGSFFRNAKTWSYFIHTSLAVALYVGVYGLAQHAGLIEGGRNRVDSTLGNAAYMAIYMLFHIFFAALMAVKTKDWFYRGLYAILILVFFYVLIQTGTRGTYIGLIGGGAVSALYMIIFSRSYPKVRNTALGTLAVLVLLAGSIFTFKDSEFVQSSLPLKRIANISLQEDLEIRFTIWNMAIEGVKERPLLGWGQGNFNYIFNEQYNPSLWNAEAWYDRAHNIAMDWLVAGGILGLLGYLSIFIASVYYLFWRPLFVREDTQQLPVAERAVLLGLLAGYFTHNMVVFDNIVSYMFFAVTLGYLQFGYGKDWPAMMKFEIDEKLVTNIVAPVMIVATGLTIYFVNVPGIQAAHDIIEAYTASDAAGRLEAFEQAIERDSFAYQEIVEQTAQQSINIVNNNQIPAEQREAFAEFTERELLTLVEQKPGDARLHVFLTSVYRSRGDLDKAAEQSAIARSLSPQKQTIILEQGVIAYQQGNLEVARDYFKEAFELDTEFANARRLYASLLLYTGDVEKAEELITDEYITQFANDDFAVQAANAANATDLLVRIFEARSAAQPNNPQHRASLSFVHYQAGDTEAAIAVLEQAASDIPSFSENANCFITNLEAGRDPAVGCGE